MIGDAGQSLAPGPREVGVAEVEAAVGMEGEAIDSHVEPVVVDEGGAGSLGDAVDFF